MLTVEHYLQENGADPFANWLMGLDKKTMARIVQRIDRFKLGNLGDHKHTREGVFEARLDFGPGYRLYFLRDGSKIIVLLCGGDKGTQDRDIDRAVDFLRDYHSRREP
ncbi:addiction module protein [Vogesella sp. EB]|uniref:type II toxin-antitoxin system RelE/ParE family toxin n=1 Tax=Vogesella sp. EB TaxID=1526735 RepID=UPI00064CFE34|nr:type II toxin-antitoxin system RelE/ParE family toxin [Vogesella sp. EB]KMJ53778.1 addiction module protein [Vogesella sp. EB]